jgi:hypothetical protein
MPYALIRDVFGFRLEIHDDDSPSEARAKLEGGVARYMGEGNEQKAHLIGHLLGFDFSHSPHLKGILGDAKQVERAFHAAASFPATATEVAAGALPGTPDGRRPRTWCCASGECRIAPPHRA